MKEQGRGWLLRRVFWRLCLPGIVLTSIVGGCEGTKKERGSGEPPVISFWTTEGYQPEEVQWLKTLASRFQEQTGTRVDIEFFTWEEITSKYLAALEAKRPPNIGQHGPDLPLRFAQEGHLLPMDELVEQLGKERFYPEFLDRACWYQGHYWSVPWFIEVRPLLVRMDWLAELGMEAPSTWDEWLRVCQAMTQDRDGDGKTDRWGFGLYGRDTFGQTWVAMAAQNGGGLFGQDGSIQVDAPENVEALQWYCDLYLKHQVTPPGTKNADWTTANHYYKQGLVGTLITNGYLLLELQRDAPEILRHSRFVPLPARTQGGPSISYLGGSHLMVFKDAPHSEQARRFVRFLLEDENYLPFLKTTSGGMLPVFQDISQDEYFQQDDNRRVLVEQIRGAVRHGYRGPPRPAVGAAEGEGVFGLPVEQVLTRSKTAAEALKEARRRTERIFAQQEGGPPVSSATREERD